MSEGWEFLEWIRLSIRHREEELELLRRMEANAYRRVRDGEGDGGRPDERLRIGDTAAPPRPSDDSPEERGARVTAQSGGLSQRREAWKSLDDRIHEAALSPALAFPELPVPAGSERQTESTWPEASVTDAPVAISSPDTAPPDISGEETSGSEPPTLKSPERGPLDHPTVSVPASAVTPTPSEHARKEAHDRTASVADDTVDDTNDAAADEPIPDPVEEPTGDPVDPQTEAVVESTNGVTATAIAPAPVEEEPAVGPVLLMEQDGCWIAFPWNEVDRVALTEEIPIAPGHRFRFSLRDLLAERVKNPDRPEEHRPTEAEPFAVLWKRDHGLSLLCCRRFGGITTVEEALARRVKWIVRPPRLGEGREPQFETLDAAPRSQSAAPTNVSHPPSPPATPDPDPAPSNGAPPNGLSHRHRVLLAVPYLPVRVALSRSFRRADWEVTEEFDPARVREAIQDRDYDALFVDLTDPMDPGLVQLLEQERFAGLSLVAIGSRFQRPHENASARLAGAPRLQFPFQDEDVGRVVDLLSRR